MVRPDLGVVVKLGDFVDLILSLNIAMLRDPEIHAHTASVDGLPIESGIRNRLMRTIDGNGSSTRSPTHFLPLLISQLVKITDTSQHGRHVAGLVIHNARLALQQILAVFRQIIAVGGSEPDPGDDNAVVQCQRNSL